MGLYYLCGYCTTEVIPQKEALKTKSKPKKTQPNMSAANSSRTANPVSVGQTPLNQGNSTDSSTAENLSQNQNDESSQDASTDELTEENVNGPGPRHHPRSPQAQSAHVNNPVPEVCTFYRLGRCRHGISGKADGTCAYSHPKPCQKFLTNGNRSRRGCTLGRRTRQ